MGSRRSSSSSTEDLGWQPAWPTDLSQIQEAPPEEIQVLLLGAPGSGKTRLQARYILRQFVDIKSELARRMGGHKYLRLLDGTSVHLISHELRIDGGPDAGYEDARYLEDRQRKRLLAQCDAVMLTFDPWAEETFEWISGKVADDILEVGQKKRLTSDFARLMDDLAAAMPQRLQSPLPAVPFRSSSDGISTRLDESGNGDGHAVLSPKGGGNEHESDRNAYQAAFKRISIALDRSGLMEAEDFNHEKTLPPLPLQGPAPSRLNATTSSTRMKSERLPEIQEVEESAKDPKQVATMEDGEQAFASKHDSAISIQSSQSADSQTALLPASHATTAPAHAPEPPSPPSQPPPREAHPALRPTTLPPETAAELAALLRQRQREDARAGTTEAEANELPILVVATMTDRLRDTTARHVTAAQGQRLARRFGPHCGYIETSARANANVDEAYGIIVEQVMARRAAARRDERARVRLEAALQTLRVGGGGEGGDGDGSGSGGSGRGGGRGGGRSGASRTCVPRLGWDWNWLVARAPPVLSWEAITGALGGGRKAAEVEMKVGGGLVTAAAVRTREESVRNGMGKVVGAKTQEGGILMTLVARQQLKGVVAPKGSSSGSGQDEIAGRSKLGVPTNTNTTSNPNVNQKPERPVKQTATATTVAKTTGPESEIQPGRTNAPPGSASKSSKNNNSLQATRSNITDRPSNIAQKATSQAHQGHPTAAPRHFDVNNVLPPIAPPSKPETVDVAAAGAAAVPVAVVAERASAPAVARVVSQLWTQEISSDGSVVMVPPPGTRTRGVSLQPPAHEKENNDNKSTPLRKKKTSSLAPPPPPPPPPTAKKTQTPPSPRAPPPPPPPKPLKRATTTTTTKNSRVTATTAKITPSVPARPRAAAAKTPKSPPRRAAPASAATTKGRTGDSDEGGRRKTPADETRLRSGSKSVVPDPKKSSISARPPPPKPKPKPKPQSKPQRA